MSGKRVVELGAGCGAMGLAAGLATRSLGLPPPERFVLSDVFPPTLSNLAFNCLLNDVEPICANARSAAESEDDGEAGGAHQRQSHAAATSRGGSADTKASVRETRLEAGDAKKCEEGGGLGADATSVAEDDCDDEGRSFPDWVLRTKAMAQRRGQGIVWGSAAPSGRGGGGALGGEDDSEGWSSSRGERETGSQAVGWLRAEVVRVDWGDRASWTIPPPCQAKGRRVAVAESSPPLPDADIDKKGGGEEGGDRRSAVGALSEEATLGRPSKGGREEKRQEKEEKEKEQKEKKGEDDAGSSGSQMETNKGNSTSVVPFGRDYSDGGSGEEGRRNDGSTSEANDEEERRTFHFILGSDLVYDANRVDVLAAAVKSLLKKPDGVFLYCFHSQRDGVGHFIERYVRGVDPPPMRAGALSLCLREASRVHDDDRSSWRSAFPPLVTQTTSPPPSSVQPQRGSGCSPLRGALSPLPPAASPPPNTASPSAAFLAPPEHAAVG